MDKRSSAATCERSQRSTPPPVPKVAVPWLIFPYGKGKKSQAFYGICDPDNTTLRKSIPELRGKSFWQRTCHQNWLIIVCKEKKYESIYNLDNLNHGDCFLWNPVSLESIQLPSLLEWLSKPKKYVLIDCLLTSPPDRHHQDESTVIFLFSAPFNKKDIVLNKKGDILLLFCRPGNKQWGLKKICRGDIAGDFGGELISLHSVKGRLYVTFERETRLLEIEEAHLLDDNGKTLSIRPLQPVTGDPKVLPLGADRTDFYYVESDDAIFKIWVCFNGRCKQVMLIEVCRLDFSSMKWEDLNDLGDHVIFAGTNTGFCCSAAKLGFKSGGFYYTLRDDQNLYKFEANGGNAVILPCLQLKTPWFPSEWIMLMPEDGQKSMENNGEQQQQPKDITLKEVEGNKTCAASNINGSCGKHSKEEISPWDTLSEDTVVLISKYLHPLDYVHFRSVCKVNRRLMPPTTQKRAANSAGCPCLSPWLMFSRDNKYNFIDPVHDNETYLLSFCEFQQGATIRHQKDGWLLMSREKEIFFYNPFTREIIKLPDLPDGYHISNICFDVSPTASDCVVFAVDQSDLDLCILITLRGQDMWFPMEFPSTNVEKLMQLRGTAPIEYNGVFYCVDYNGTLGAFHPMEDVYWSVLARPKKIFNNDMHPNLLVVCGGDLLLVKLGHLGKAVRIFRLDFSTMEWVKVESLGKHMLFISETSCLSAIAPNSQMENVICFPRLYLNGGGILLYSLGTGSYRSSSVKNQQSLNSFCATKGWLSNCSWIQPNWSKSTEQELDWLNCLGRNTVI